MTWILPTLVIATFGGQPTLAAPLTGPLVVAQTSVPSRGGAQASAPGAPAETSTDAGAAAEGQAAPPGDFGQTIMVMGLIFLFFWLFFIRPQNKQMKEHKLMIEGLRKGDNVVTQGGLFGTVAGFDDSTGAVLIEIAKNVRVKVVRSNIARLQSTDSADKAESKTK